MSSSKTPPHSPSNPPETAEVRVLYPRGLLRSNYTSAHVVLSSRIYWKTANDDATSVPLSLMDFRNANSLELIRLNEGTWDEVDDIVKVENTGERRRITIPGRLHGRELRNKCFGRDVQVEIIPDAPSQHEAWVNKIRARIAPWNLLQQEMRNASGVEEIGNALGGLAKGMVGIEPSSMSTDKMEERREKLGNLPEKMQKLSLVDKMTAHGAVALGSGGTLEKLVKSAEHVTETAELLADLSKCIGGLSAIFQLVSLSAQGVSMWAEASRGRRVLLPALGQITILLWYVLESLAKIMEPSLNVNETAIDFVFNALKEAVSLMDMAETQLLRGNGSQIVNAEDVKNVETKIHELKQMAVIADNTSGVACNSLRISSLDEKMAQLEGEREIRGDVPHHVRPSVSAFFSGRKNELKTLEDILAKWGSAVITQYGGVGKTELMIAFADRAEQCMQVPGGVFWVTVDGGEKDVISSLAGLAEKLMRRKMSEQDRRNANLVIAWLKHGLSSRPGRWLLCLDNADDDKVGRVLNEVCRIAGPSRGNGWVVVTSRQGKPYIWTGMKREQKLVLKPLCAEDATVALWRQIHKIETADADDDSVMTEIKEMKGANQAEYCALKKLCGDDSAQGLGGLPLALVQAGSYIAEFEDSFAEYLNLFESANKKEKWEDFMNEADELTSIRESQRSIWTTWRISVDKLSEKALTVLRIMSMLGQGGTGETIVNGILKATAADEDVDVKEMFREVIVKELIHGSSLICRDKGVGEERYKYKMHRLVRLFILKEMGRGSATWNDVFRLALPAVHECVKFELENEGNSFDKLPDVLVSRHREFVTHSVALVHHHILPVRGVEIRYVSEVVHIHRYGAKVMEFMGKSEEEVRVWEHLSIILHHQQAAERQRNSIEESRSRGEEWKSRIADVYNSLGCALMRTGKLDSAAARLEESLRMKRALHGHEQPHPEIALSLNNLGNVYRKMGKLKSALEKHEQSMVMEQAIHRHGKPHPNIAKSLNNLGNVYRQMGKLHKALEKHEQSLDIEMEIHGQGKPHPNIAKSLDNLGLVYRQMGKLEKAMETHNQSLKMKLAIHGNAEPNPDIAKSLDNLGNVYRQMGKLNQAWERHDQSLKMKKEIHANIELHPDIAMSFDNFGLVYEAMGKLEKAQEKHEQSLSMKRAIHGLKKLHPDIAKSLDNLGNVYRLMGELDKAQEKYTESPEMKQKIYGQGTPHPNIAKTFDNLGLMYEAKSNLGKALEKYEQSLKMKRAIHGRGNPHPDIAKSLDNLGLVYRQMGKLRRALSKHQQSLEMKREIYGNSEPHTDIAKSFDNLGVVYRKLGKLDEALKNHKQSFEMKLEIHGDEEPHPTIAKSLDNLGLVCRLKGKLTEALKNHERSLKMKRAIHGHGVPHLDIAKSLDNLGLVYRESRELDKSMEMHIQSLEMKRAIHGQKKPHQDILSSLKNLNAVHRKSGELKKVLENYEEIVDMKKAIHGQDTSHPDVAKSLDDLGNMYRQMRKPGKALKTHEDSLKMKQAIHGQSKPHPDIITSLNNLGLVYRQMKQYDKALEKYEQILDMKRAIHRNSEEHPEIAKSLDNLGIVYREMDKLDKALEKHEESLKIRRAIHGQGVPHSDIVTSLNNLGHVYRQMKQSDKALEKYEQILGMKRAIHGSGEPHPEIAKYLDNLGTLYCEMGKLDKALEKHEESLEMKRAIHGHGEPHSEIAKSLDNIGHVYRQMGELHKALEKHESSLKMKQEIHGHGELHPDIKKSQNNLENLYSQIRKRDNAADSHEKSEPCEQEAAS